MSSTNKTTNYELSQFLGTDKPAWLSDYNSDMSKIDAQMKSNADTATAASGASSANTSAIGTLASLTTDAQSDLVSAINEVDAHADTAQNTANTALGNAGAANTAISTLESYLSLSTTGSFASATTTNGSVRYLDMYYASNASGSLGKIYGQIDIDTVTTSFSTITLANVSPFRPESDISILALGVCASTGITTPAAITIKTDGTVLIKATMQGNTLNRIILHPALLFIEDFGDVVNQ